MSFSPDLALEDPLEQHIPSLIPHHVAQILQLTSFDDADEFRSRFHSSQVLDIFNNHGILPILLYRQCSKVWSFDMTSSFRVQVSAPYRRTEQTQHFRSLFFIYRVRSWLLKPTLMVNALLAFSILQLISCASCPIIFVIVPIKVYYETRSILAWFIYRLICFTCRVHTSYQFLFH